MRDFHPYFMQLYAFAKWYSAHHAPGSSRKVMNISLPQTNYIPSLCRLKRNPRRVRTAVYMDKEYVDALHYYLALTPV